MINAAIVGLGSWGRKLVGSVQGKSDQIRFSSAVTRTVSKAEDFAKTHDMALGDDLASVLADPAIDAVVVAGPNPLHVPHGLAALDAGKPTMVIKPMALHLAEAKQLQAASDKAGVLLALGYNRCFMPEIVELRRRVRAGDLGTILHAEGNFCVDRYLGLKPGSWKSDLEQSPAGSLADHMLYNMISILGPIAEVTTKASGRATETSLMDTAATVLKFVDGTSGLLTAIGATGNYHRLVMFGDKGWAELRGTGNFSFQPIGGKLEEIKFPKFEPEHAQLEAFARAVTGEVEFEISPSDAVHGVGVIEAMGQSAQQGKTITLS